jgi:probable rRNA maturation factor
VIVHFTDEQDDPLEPGPLEQIALATMADERLPDATEVGLTLVDEPAMAALNQTHMAKTGPTDVLSFPLEDLTPGLPLEVAEEGPPPFLGDVIICPSVVARNAAAEQVPFEDEMALMVVHGLLHLLGYDHVVDAEAEYMEQREREVLAGLGRVRP